MELSVENLMFSYRCFPVLKGVDFRVESGNLVCLLGKNGAGKSTLFRCIMGLLKSYEGRITAENRVLKGLSARELAGMIAYIPQNHDTAFSFSVLDMVLMGTTAALDGFANPGQKERELAMKALETMEISHLSARSYAHISGGEQQMVLIARAIAQQAGILVMDEPCANLDYGNQARVMERLKGLAKAGYLILLSTHSPDQALLYGDQALVLIDGAIEAFGEPKQVLTGELLERVYGIPVEVKEIKEDGTMLCVPGRRNQ